jgi:hypothetical protein
MLRRNMFNIRAPHRSDPGFPDSAKSMHIPRSKFAGVRVMTMTYVWIGLALWLGLNVAFVARRIYVTRRVKIAANFRRTHVRLV